MNKYPKELEETFMERFLILVLLFEKHGNEICTYFTELQGEFYTLLQRVVVVLCFYGNLVRFVTLQKK